MPIVEFLEPFYADVDWMHVAYHIIDGDFLHGPVLTLLNCGPRGGTGGAKPGSGVQRFWGPLGASENDPSFQ